MENKIFKRTLLVSVALLSTGVRRKKEVGINSDFNVDVYGVAAISLVNYNTTDCDDASSGYAVENRISYRLRAHKRAVCFDDVLITMQIESGYVDSTDWSHGGVSGGVLGFRDTFIGASGS